MSFAEDTCSGPIIGEKCPSDYHHSLYLINPNITNRSFLSSSPRSQSVTVSSKCIQSTQMSLIVPFWAVYLFLSDLSPPRCYIHLRWSCFLNTELKHKYWKASSLFSLHQTSDLHQISLQSFIKGVVKVEVKESVIVPASAAKSEIGRVRAFCQALAANILW